MKKNLSCLLFILWFCSIQGQKKDFSYSPNNVDSIENYLNKVTNNKILSFEIKQQKRVKEILLERKTHFLKSIKDSTFIFDEKIHTYLNKILAEIYHSNPQIQTQDFYFLINKSLIPNAACYGNGIYTVNLGMFNLIKTDDEMAYIICHELSHHILKHNDKSLENYIKTFSSKDVKQQINTASNKKYGRRSAITSLLKDLKFNFMKRSRIAETQADSLGYILFNRTKYNKHASVDILKKLDLSDEMIFNNPTNLKTHFSFEQYPFKESWIEKEDKIFNLSESANDLQIDKDSIKTHPDIPLRIEKLNRNNIIVASNSNTNEIESIQKRTYENSIQIFSDDLKLDFTLYQLLSLHEKGLLDDKKYINEVANLLKKLYDLKEKHLFGKYISPLNSFSEENSINEIRLFLNNLELKNIKKIGYYFCKKNELLSKNDPEFQDSYNFFKNLNQN